MWKKIKTYGGIGVLAALVLLIYFPSAPAPSDGKIHIRYWYVTGVKEDIPHHVKLFNESQDKIFVNATPLPWNEHEKKILTSILSEDPPDIVNLVTPVAKWASRLALTPLDEFMERDSFDSSIFFPALWEEMIWQDKISALPLYSNSYAMFYNKSLFREAGLDPEKPPATWEELLDYSEKLTKRDSRGRFQQMGFIPNYGNLHTSVLMSWQLGAEFLRNDGTEVSLDNPESVRALRWETEFFEKYPVQPVSSFMAGFGYADQHGFLSGKVAMMMLDNTFPDQIKLYKPDLDYGVAVIPTFNGYETATSSGSWWIAIPRGAKNTEAAWEFMKFAVKKETQLRESASQQEILFPANKHAANDSSFIRGDNKIQVLVDMMEYAHSPTIVPMAHDIFWREYLGARERAIHRLQTPEQALKQAQNVIQYQLDQAIEYDMYVRSKMNLGGL
jgi:multiple sugar transport system substrate-binding protein